MKRWYTTYSEEWMLNSIKSARGTRAAALIGLIDQ